MHLMVNYVICFFPHLYTPVHNVTILTFIFSIVLFSNIIKYDTLKHQYHVLLCLES